MTTVRYFTDPRHGFLWADVRAGIVPPARRTSYRDMIAWCDEAVSRVWEKSFSPASVRRRAGLDRAAAARVERKVLAFRLGVEALALALRRREANRVAPRWFRDTYEAARRRQGFGGAGPY